MFGISGEHLIILTIILLVFGPKRIPGVGRTIGKTFRNFKDGIEGVKEAEFRKIGDKTDKSKGAKKGT